MRFGYLYFCSLRSRIDCIVLGRFNDNALHVNNLTTEKTLKKTKNLASSLVGEDGIFGQDSVLRLTFSPGRHQHFLSA